MNNDIQFGGMYPVNQYIDVETDMRGKHVDGIRVNARPMNQWEFQLPVHDWRIEETSMDRGHKYVQPIQYFDNRLMQTQQGGPVPLADDMFRSGKHTRRMPISHRK